MTREQFIEEIKAAEAVCGWVKLNSNTGRYVELNKEHLLENIDEIDDNFFDNVMVSAFNIVYIDCPTQD